MASPPAGPDRSAEHLRRWISEVLHAPEDQKRSLLTALSAVLEHQRDLWEASKLEAVQALSSGFAAKLERLQSQLAAKEATEQVVARYFEDVVAALTDKSHRDPKTRLINFDWFMQRLESFLAIEQRAQWCAAGVVDITSFKWFNDHLGHTVADRLIARVARLLAEQCRSEDLLTQEGPSDLHARFGGDEFCFLVPHVPGPAEAFAIAQRFKRHVEGFDWTQEDARLARRPVMVDVGVVCLALGPLEERRHAAKALAEALVERADHLMYRAKTAKSPEVVLAVAAVRDGRLVETGSGTSMEPAAVSGQSGA
jgi:diguanylate cyclase (GGDEF)-like protein